MNLIKFIITVGGYKWRIYGVPYHREKGFETHLVELLGAALIDHPPSELCQATQEAIADYLDLREDQIVRIRPDLFLTESE